MEERADERFRQTIGEYFGFKNEFPESKYIKEADNIYKQALAKTTKSKKRAPAKTEE